MLIRAMSRGDAGAIASLNQEMQYHADADQIAARFDVLSRQPGNGLFVAESDGDVVGWAHVHVMELLQTEPYAALVGLAVRLDARQQRIGAQLIDACRAWARERGHGDVRLP
ncbi:MAG TPA: GNAT family N-acetyltransferase [Albitalea sp.]